jgi:hypothetical protein
VDSNEWAENTLDYGNIPPVGTLLARTGAFPPSEWITVDLSAYITGEGQYTISLGTLGTSSISLASRESQDHAPQLVIELR